MNQEVHISGIIRSTNTFVTPFINLLDALHIHTNHSLADEHSFYITSEHPAWHHYDTELARYEVIKNAPFHILFNDAPINEKVAREVAYAIAQEKPILMVGSPHFATKITPLLKDSIESNLTAFYPIDFADLTQESLVLFIKNLKSVNYNLSANEKALIHSRVRAHFRHLLEEARDIYVER